MERSGLNRKRAREPYSLLRYHWRTSFIYISSFLLFSFANGQDLSTHRTDTVSTLTYILPGDVDVHSIKVQPGVTFQILEDPLRIEFLEKADLPVIISYRVISSLLRNYPALYDTSKYDPRGTGPIVKQQQVTNQQPVGLLDGYSNMYKSGAITRGITVGNRQNLYVNSTLNLQIQGEISEDLMLTASITDQNIPFQPEGNTQQLRDFDNVLIDLQGKNFGISAGDIVIRNPEDYGYFLKYYKNQQGFKVTSSHAIGDEWSLQSTGSIAIAKGKFATKQLQPIEGVQGPYRLRGNDNERFITILANSEKIYLDGEQLIRGFDQDYVIDYNLGEITFTSKVVITRFSRIRVDYEYAQQYYVRSNFLLSEVLTNGRHRVYFDYYRSTDNANRPLQFDNDIAINDQLSQLGDPGLQGAFISNTSTAQPVEPGNYYSLKDTLANGLTYSVYAYSTTADSLLRVVFTEVGQGKGNYVIAGSNGYGRIYQWIAPVDGVSQGSFDPVQQVITPQSQEMFVSGANIQLTDYLTLDQELAVSRQDNNLYSSLDDSDNAGLAWRGDLTYNRKFKKGLRINAGVAGEFDNANFRPIDRFRTIEFDRDWSYPFPYDSIGKDDRFLESNFSIQTAKQQLSYRNLYRNRTGELEGWQHFVNHHQQLGIFHLEGKHFLMNNELSERYSQWRRSFTEAYVAIDSWQSGLFLRLDQNAVQAISSDSVISTAMYYQEQGAFIRSSSSKQLTMDLSLSDRKDSRPSQGELVSYTDARQGRLAMSWQPAPSHKLSVQGVYRQTMREDSTTLPNDNIIQGGLQAQNAWWKNVVTHQLHYQTQNSRELRREYIYTQVGAGQGTHTWRDENNNGVAELDEFYEAINQDEKNYIRLFVPTDEYIEAFQTNYQHALNVAWPSHIELTGWLDKLENLSATTNWNIIQKVDESDVLKRINPYQEGSDSTLLMRRATINYGVFYNRNRPGLGLSINRSNRSYKQLNTNGFELDDKSFDQLSIRYNFTNVYMLAINTERGFHEHAADFLNNRNFDLAVQAISSEASWTPSPKSRVSLSYGLRQKENVLNEDSPESVSVHKAEGSFTWIDAGKRNLNARFGYSYIDFHGAENTYLGYVLLEALRPGNNYQLNLNLNQTLRNGLQLTVNYFGRKSENQSIIHTGSVNLTAFF